MKNHLKYFCTVAVLLLFCNRSFAQKIISAYNNESEISAPSSVTLIDGFHTMGPVRIFTTGISYLNCVPLASTPSANQNYILTHTFKLPVTDATLGNSRNVCDENQTIQYFDGLGRPSQTVQVQGSSSFKDIVQPIAYDAFGREQFKYQFYAAQTGTTGSFRPSAITEQFNFFRLPTVGGIKATDYAVAETQFEASPLNRVQQQGAPGQDWQLSSGRTLKREYGTNLKDEVKLWTVNSNDNGAVASNYLPGRLYKTIFKDENWIPTDFKAGITEEFKDFDGHVVLKRVWENDSKNLSTYYVYDDLGNLRYVLPPAVNDHTDRLPDAINSFSESDPVFDQFIYGYHYDSDKRTVEKKIPGKGWEYLVYNKLNQVVLTQDANQRAKNVKEWMCTKYDALGRIVLVTQYFSDDDRITEQQKVDQSIFLWEEKESDFAYTLRCYPDNTTNINGEYMVMNFYDNYDFSSSYYYYFNNLHASVNNSNKTKGLLTGRFVNTPDINDGFLYVYYYDDEGRIIETANNNYVNGTDHVKNMYNFDSSLKSSVREHISNGASTIITNRYEYDHLGRKIASFSKINSQDEITLNHLEYNEIGQLKNKKVNNDMQNTAFAYNERGWLKSITSDQFSMDLKYNDGIVPQFNGNISGQDYTNGNVNSFAYRYDGLNRLLKSTAGNNLGEEIEYDVMGNIKKLTRDDFGTNNYAGYDGNKLTAINGFTNGIYGYDNNGNQKKNTASGITNIDYNFLNLPINIAGPNVSYVYDAAGKKLRKQNASGTINYVDGIQYKTDGQIDFIHTEEGIARNNSGSYSYEYNLTDHLGNVRATFYKNPNTNKLEVLQRDDYYAFGMRKKGIPNSNTNKYLYNGKEFQEELGQYDYGARFYDPVVGRFATIDPLAEISRKNSSYSYALNNPIRFIDVDGMYAGESGTYKNGDKDFGEVLKYFGIASKDDKINENKDSDENTPDKDITETVEAPHFSSLSTESLGDTEEDEDGAKGKKKGKGKDKDKLRGGSQKDRDQSIKRYPIEFQRWYHKNIKPTAHPGRDATPEELEEGYEDWIQQGRPSAMVQIPINAANVKSAVQKTAATVVISGVIAIIVEYWWVPLLAL